MKPSQKKSLNDPTAKKIDEISEIQKRVDSANNLVGEVDAINQTINGFLFERGNSVVDLKNFSIMNITPFGELI
jgi:flagellar hook-associated protein FlgK